MNGGAGWPCWGTGGAGPTLLEEVTVEGTEVGATDGAAGGGRVTTSLLVWTLEVPAAFASEIIYKF